MSVPGAPRSKTFAAGGSGLPADFNSMQDIYGLGRFSPGALTESRTNTAYGTMTTADQVAGVVLPTDGLIAVAYQATWQESVAGAANAAIFIGSNQLKSAANNSAAPTVQATSLGAAGEDHVLTATWAGLYGTGSPGNPYGGDVTTGQVVGNISTNSGPPCYIFAAAGTYTISIQFKASSGSVTRKNPHLWVWTLGS